jgi:hypothetical protein
MGDVVYRVTVKYPEVSIWGGSPRLRVKYGGKQVVSQCWSYYLMAYANAQRRARNDAVGKLPDFEGPWDLALKNAVYKVEVAPNTAFEDQSHLYDVEQAIEAKRRLSRIDYAA